MTYKFDARDSSENDRKIAEVLYDEETNEWRVVSATKDSALMNLYRPNENGELDKNYVGRFIDSRVPPAPYKWATSYLRALGGGDFNALEWILKTKGENIYNHSYFVLKETFES